MSTPEQFKTIDNADVVNKVVHSPQLPIIPDLFNVKTQMNTIDDSIVNDNIIRGQRAQRSRAGTVKSTIDNFARYFVDQANIDESLDWVNHNPELDADPKFQPMYQK